VALQIALALVVVLAAGLLAGTLGRLSRVPLGFDAGPLLVVSVNASRSAVDASRRLDLAQRLTEAIAAVPGVAHAAASLWTPLSGEGALTTHREPGPAGAGDREIAVLTNFVTPGWFRTYGTALHAGRDFTMLDSLNAPRVVIVNRAFARRFFQDGPVLGRLTSDGMEIVGVVAEAVYRSSQRIPGVASLALREPVPPTMYAPLAQLPKFDRPPVATIRLSVRVAGGAPAALAPEIGRTIASIDPDLSVTSRPLVDYVTSALGQERMTAAISSSFAVLALLLATLGIYGVTAHAVTGRTAEIGVRLALGATPASVVRTLLARALGPIVVGIAAGLVAGAVSTQAIASQLFGVTPLDATTFVVVALVMAALGTIAALLPALRVRQIDANHALRRE
jgi:predicted permease